MKFKRIHLIVLDSVGIGEAPDAADFNDLGSHTLGHIAEVAGLKVPHMVELGLANIESIACLTPAASSKGYWTTL